MPLDDWSREPPAELGNLEAKAFKHRLFMYRSYVHKPGGVEETEF
jgi:hypothetical protein